MKETAEWKVYKKAFEDARVLYLSLMKLGSGDAPKIVGIAGELLVKSELLRNGIEIVPKGGQSGNDLILKKTGEGIGIRTSRLKRVPKGSSVENYGWTVLKRKEQQARYDYLICVAFNKELADPRFYIFTKEEALKGKDVHIGGIGSVRKRIMFFETPQDLETAMKENPTDVEDWDRVRELDARKNGFARRCWEFLGK